MYNNIIALILVVIIILLSAFKNKKPTCERFIFNTYMYTFFMILFLYTIHLKILSNENIQKCLDKPKLLVIMFIVNIALLYFVLSTNVSKYISKHLLLVAWLFLFGISTYHITKQNQMLNKNNLTQIFTVFFILVIIATLIVTTHPKLITHKWGFPLLLGLISLIIVQIISFFNPQKKKNNFIVYFSIILFTTFIAYDTQLAINASKNCIEGKADYIQHSIGLFLDFVNLFINLRELN
jgi:FtsH-binding integral membrane protein